MAPTQDEETSAPTEGSSGPLSLSQRQSLIWLDSQLFPASHLSNLFLLIEIHGELDCDRMQKAWKDTVQDFDALRIQILRDEPKQIYSAADTTLPCIPVSDDAELKRWVDERSAEPLGPGGKLWEAALLRLGPEKHAFYLCQHHIISDGLSIINLFHRLSTRYAGDLPTEPRDFTEYLDSEATYLASKKAQKDSAYWKEYLQDPPPPIQLYGNERSDASIGLSRSRLQYDETLTQRLRDLTQHESFAAVVPAISRIIAATTAFVAFLSRACGNSEILLGLPYGNRPRRFADTYGLMMEQIFIRAQVEADDTYTSLATRIRHELLNSIRHGRACVSDRGLQYATLNMLPQPPSRFAEFPAKTQIGSATTRGTEPSSRTADLRNTIGIQLFDFENEALSLNMDLHAATFSPSTQKRVCAHFGKVLAAMVEDPDALISAVTLLDETEELDVLRAGRGHEESTPPLDVIEQFTEQAHQHPDRLAIHAPDQSVTYGELDAYSSALAQHLLDRGLEPGARVALAMPRGAREVTAMLAILKAHGVYIPLDLRHPPDRVATILDDARPQYLVAPSDSPLTGILPPDAQHIPLDELSRPAEPSSPLHLTPESGQLAYILFTSGSTGRPKGVSIPRSALANFLRSMAHTPGMTDSDHLLAVTTTTFDISGLELLLPLWTGAKVTIADYETTADPRRLRATLEGGDFTLMQATPATWHMLLDAGWVNRSALKILCGGEALSPELANRLLGEEGELWNLYGPTETTIWSAAMQIERGFDKITIGHPIDSTQLLILDAQGELVSPGVVGEIYIGGAGLAEGYCDRPELTEKAFIDGLLHEKAGRLYRTGDLGRLLEDGRFECLGRNDHQIKIRGFRIELGEIESVLAEHPGVSKVLATADQTDPDSSAISVYWIGSASATELQALAQKKLPHYMLPSAYLELETFPLNTSGKIDRRALPKATRPSTPSSSDALPRNDREVQIAALWRSLLNLDDVGRDIDFFEAGGTSFLIIKLRDRLEQEFGFEISLRTCFEHPTVAGLAEHLDDPDASNTQDAIVSLLRPGDEGLPRLFCLYGVHLYQDLARALPSSAQVFGMHVPIFYNPSTESCPTVSDAASRYVELIRQQQPHGPYHLAGLCFGGLVAYEAARQLEAGGETVDVLAVFDSRLPQSRSVRRGLRAWSILLRILTKPRFALEQVQRRISRRHKKNEPSPTQDERIELPIRGASVDEQARAYSAVANPIRAKVLLFRATKEPHPEWLVYERDFGWSALAKEIDIFDIPGSHLEIIRAPHAEPVAAEIQKAIGESERI